MIVRTDILNDYYKHYNLRQSFAEDLESGMIHYIFSNEDDAKTYIKWLKSADMKWRPIAESPQTNETLQDILSIAHANIKQNTIGQFVIRLTSIQHLELETQYNLVTPKTIEDIMAIFSEISPKLPRTPNATIAALQPLTAGSMSANQKSAPVDTKTNSSTATAATASRTATAPANSATASTTRPATAIAAISAHTAATANAKTSTRYKLPAGFVPFSGTAFRLGDALTGTSSAQAIDKKSTAFTGTKFKL